MMKMWFWWGYDLGEFMWPKLVIDNQTKFTITWILLFLFAFLFEASKVFLAKVQRAAYKTLDPVRCDERRNLLQAQSERAGEEVVASTSRNTATYSQWDMFKRKTLVNVFQTTVFLLHNTGGYLVMLAVMVYNVQLLIAVVLGMMLGYFIFGPKLIKMQMQCARQKRRVVCTPECDDTAQSSTPPLLDSASESDFFICETRSCHAEHMPSSEVSCSYKGSRCPSKVERVSRHQRDTGQDSQQLLEACCSTANIIVHKESSCCNTDDVPLRPTEPIKEIDQSESTSREESPQVTCCSKKSVSDSQEHIAG